MGNNGIWVKPEWVKKCLKGKSTQATDGKGFLVVEAYTGDPDEYLSGHIPGAIAMDTNAFERAPLWNVLPDDELEEALIAHGITYNQTIVLYGRHPLAAARTALVLMYAGVSDVRLLKGGIAAWNARGYKLETISQEPIPVSAFGVKIPAHPEYIIDTEQVQALIGGKNAVLACVRSREEYTGETSGYDYISAKGHIPGSVWAGLPAPDALREEPNRIVDQSILGHPNIAAIWRERGITPDKMIVFYCGTNWRASEAFLFARELGWKNSCIYGGGWVGWTSGSDRPIETDGTE